MGGKDKTSWLEGLEHDDDLPDNLTKGDGAFTEVAQGSWEKTDGATSERKTEVMFTPDAGVEKTRIDIVGFGTADEAAPVQDPVTGWLVIIEGPGKGNAIGIGTGLNRIGRSTSERVALPFGDTLISSEDHLRIIYDDEGRSFLVVPGSGKNVSRVNGQIIAAPMVLENYVVLQLSKVTKVRFAAFCGTEFDWSDLADRGAAG